MAALRMAAVVCGDGATQLLALQLHCRGKRRGGGGPAAWTAAQPDLLYASLLFLEMPFNYHYKVIF